jgi:2-keto-4-pentenoate hydratase
MSAFSSMLGLYLLRADRDLPPMGMAHEEIAQRIYAEHRGGVRFHSLARDLDIPDVDTAYRIQQRYTELMIGTEGDPIGYKIGLTSSRMQRMCNIDSPVSGAILANRVHRSGGELDLRRYGRLGVEFEIALRLGRDLNPADAPFNEAEMGEAVDGVCAAIELVDDRHADYSSLDAISLIADNSWNAGAVLGNFVSGWDDLSALCGIVRLNGIEIDRGYGRDVLGHPLVPLTWLANHLARTAKGLRAGDVVLTGSIAPTRFPHAGENFDFDLIGVGTVAVRVSG